jgi:arginine exporter protein ArgO
VLGVFLGSASWWLLLSSGVGLFHRQLDPRLVRWLNRGSGSILFALGALVVLSLAK